MLCPKCKDENGGFRMYIWEVNEVRAYMDTDEEWQEHKHQECVDTAAYPDDDVECLNCDHTGTPETFGYKGHVAPRPMNENKIAKWWMRLRSFYRPVVGLGG